MFNYCVFLFWLVLHAICTYGGHCARVMNKVQKLISSGLNAQMIHLTLNLFCKYANLLIAFCKNLIRKKGLLLIHHFSTLLRLLSPENCIK